MRRMTERFHSLVALFAAPLLALACLAGADPGMDAKPVPVILDVDRQSDVDDVGALAWLHVPADLGEARIPAVGVSTANPHTAPDTDRIPKADPGEIAADLDGLMARAPSMPRIIPQPVDIQPRAGSFTIGEGTRVAARGEAAEEARKLIDTLAPAMGFGLSWADHDAPASDVIVLRLRDDLRDDLGEEGYRLDVTPRRVELEAAASAGLFYGIQTFRQLLPAAIFERDPVADITWAVPCVTLHDRPRFGWRGLLVDPARHFLPKIHLLRFIDWMALHKFNRLQLHLTDDQGWRLEIRRYPRLTDIGAWRDETLIGHSGDAPPVYDGRTHGGYYTQEDIRQIVEYARQRHITIVPEIEMPGHARAAIAAYPRLGVFPDEQRDLRPWTQWGISEHIFSPRPETLAFLQDVLAEVMELFPGEFIHIGGDEAIKQHWERSEEVQAQIRELGLNDEKELQSWFIRQMDAFLAAHGRRLIGWDEILEGGLAPGATVMSWRGEQGGIAAARAGHDVVMAPYQHTYLDYYQGPREDEPLAIGGLITLEHIYRYEPIPAALSEAQTQYVLGAQAQLWTEYIPNFRHLQYMAYPRACAFAEVVWSKPERRDYADFSRRLLVHAQRLDALRIHYRPLDGTR
jgi:hexosaminidase